MAKEEKSNLARKALAEEILEDAKRKAERTIKRAQREKERILTESRAEAEKISQTLTGEARQEADRSKRIILAGVGIEKSRLELQAKDKAIESIIEEAIQGFASKTSYEYSAVLVRFACQAASAMETESIILDFAESDQALINDHLVEKMESEIKEKTGKYVTVKLGRFLKDISGGLVARSADGNLIFDNSFEGRFNRLKNLLRRKVAEIILTEEGKR